MQMDPEAGYGNGEALRARHCTPAVSGAAAAAAAEVHVEKNHAKDAKEKSSSSWFANARRQTVWTVTVSNFALFYLFHRSRRTDSYVAE